MQKIALALAVTVAACFTGTAAVAQAADPVLEWNVKNVPPMAQPTPPAAPAAATEAAKPAKAVKGGKKKKAKKA